MSYLLSVHWIWSTLAVLLGVAVGWLTSGRGDDRALGVWVYGALVLFIVGMMAATRELLPGRTGFYLETALLLFAVYIVGCVVSWIVHSLTASAEVDAPLQFAPDLHDVEIAPVSTPELPQSPPTAPTLAPIAPAGAAPTTRQPAPVQLAAGTHGLETTPVFSLQLPHSPPTAPTLASIAPAAGPDTATTPPAPDRPTDSVGDDLKLINGIGVRTETRLHDLGTCRFDQIAAWTPAEAADVGRRLGRPGRIEREHWIEQARLLAAGVDTVHSAAIKAGRVAPSDAPLSVDEASYLKRTLPEVATVLPDETDHPGSRPLGLVAPPHRKPDNLKRIKGIGRKNEASLHALGIWTFRQIAAWTPANVEWLGSYLAFPGRIEKERWIEQAGILAAGNETEFSRRVDHGRVATSKDEQSRQQDAEPIKAP